MFEDGNILLQEPEELCSLQKKEWDPLVQWFCDHFRVNIVKTQSIESPIVPSETKSLLIRHLCSYNQHAVHGKMTQFFFD